MSPVSRLRWAEWDGLSGMACFHGNPFPGPSRLALGAALLPPVEEDKTDIQGGWQGAEGGNRDVPWVAASLDRRRHTSTDKV